jgi:hypothetical protein
MKLDPITEEEAEELTDNLAVSEDEVDEDEDEDEDEVEDDAENDDDEAEEEESEDEEDEEDEDNEDEEKEFSEIWTNEEETKFFSEDEEMTDYMVRLFSEEANEEEIEKAIEEGEQIENDDEVITPVDANTAVIEDKETGEFTKATLDDEDIEVVPITEEEADDLTEDLAVEDTDEDEDEKEEEKEYSTLDKFFADIAQQQGQGEPEVIPAVMDPETGQLVPLEEKNDETQAPSVEVIEDKALQAVQSIQEAAAEASAQILEAKQAPVESQEEDLQEAQFSEKTFSDNTAISWLSQNRLGK